MAEAKEKTVKIRLPKDRNRNAGDLFVAVNGRSFLIQRGVTVEVPDYIAAVIEGSEEQMDAAMSYIEKNEKA